MQDAPKRRSPKVLGGVIAPGPGLVDPTGAPLKQAEQPKVEIDPEIIQHVATCDHVRLFLFISGLEGVLRRVSADLKELKPSKDRVTLLQEMAETAARTAQSLSYAKQATARFGVTFDGATVLNRDGKEVSNADTDYQKWYKWWQDYIQGMPEEEWAKAQNALEEEDADISWIKPPTESWK